MTSLTNARLLLQSASRLDTMELAIHSLQVKLSEMDGKTSSFSEKLSEIDKFPQAIVNLQASMKEFSKALLGHFLDGADVQPQEMGAGASKRAGT